MGGVVDILGEQILPGDRIAAAFRLGNIAELRVGTVLGFGERGNNLTVQVQWEISSGSDGNKRDIAKSGGIEADLFRFVKIGG